MAFLKKLVQCNKGIQTVTAMFMLLLMFTVIISIIVAYVSYNLSSQDELNIENERLQEKITLLKNIEDNKVSSVTVKNTGSIDVILRAVYVNDDGDFSTFDPSLNMNSILQPTQSLEIPLDFQPFKDAKIVATTQRGTRSIDIPPPIEYQEPPPPDTNKFYIGPMLLKFDEFWYQMFQTDVEVNGLWEPGWTVSSDSNDYCAWKIGLTNLGEKEITLNEYSCFSTFPSGSTDYRSWFLWTPDDSDYVTLAVNQTVTLYFARSSPGSSGHLRMYSNEQVCMVFLTFYGVYEDNQPYAQTIPFEAAIIVE
jgi:hypothetical protein